MFDLNTLLTLANSIQTQNGIIEIADGGSRLIVDGPNLTALLGRCQAQATNAILEWFTDPRATKWYVTKGKTSTGTHNGQPTTPCTFYLHRLVNGTPIELRAGVLWTNPASPVLPFDPKGCRRGTLVRCLARHPFPPLSMRREGYSLGEWSLIALGSRALSANEWTPQTVADAAAKLEELARPDIRRWCDGCQTDLSQTRPPGQRSLSIIHDRRGNGLGLFCSDCCSIVSNLVDNSPRRNPPDIAPETIREACAKGQPTSATTTATTTAATATATADAPTHWLEGEHCPDEGCPGVIHDGKCSHCGDKFRSP